jgi:drug/metabolite transporter (DMT)-like permease
MTNCGAAMHSPRRIYESMPDTSPSRTGAFGALMSRPYVLLILCNLFWGGNVVAGKAAVGNIDPYALMVLRWAGAAILVLPFAIEPLRRDWPTIRAKWWLYLFYGGVGYATFNALCYVAAYYTTGFNIGLDQVTINIFVMALSFIFFRTRVRALQLVGVAITIAGVALTASHGDLTRILAFDINFGDLLVITASLAYAVYSIGLRWRPQTDWRSFLFATFIGATLASLVFAATTGGGISRVAATVPSITPLGWIIAAYTMVLPSIISQMFYVRGVELIGANRASLFINLIPLFGALGSVLILHETLETFHFIAGALVIAGIVLAEWSARRT